MTGDSELQPLAEPICARCGEPLIPQEIAGKLGYWCQKEEDFRKPATTTSPADTTEHGKPALAADGGATEPPATPICPDCRAELTREEIGDDEDEEETEVAHWCSHCGEFKDPCETAPREGTA